jgi:hypothetical protein
MTELQKMWLVLGFLFALIIAALLSPVIRNRKEGEAKIASRKKGFDIEPTIVTLHVKVVDQRCFVTWIGTKTPKVVKHFVVIFQDDSKQVYEIEVEEDMYDGFEVGQIGELTLIEGKVSSYLLDE